MIKKRLLSGLLALALFSIASTTAFAAGSTTLTADGDTTINTTVKTYVSASGTVDADDENAVMSVTIGWDNVDFIYDSTTEWKPDQLKYVEIEGSWRNGGVANVTVTNRSNCKVESYVSFRKTNTEAIYNGVTARFDKSYALIDSAVDKAVAPSENFVLSVVGTPTASKTTPTTDFGIITVSIVGYNVPTSSGGSMDGNDNDG